MLVIKNALDSLRPVLFINVILGMCPLHPRNSNIKISKFLNKFTIFFILVCIFHMLSLPSGLLFIEENLGEHQLIPTSTTNVHFMAKLVNQLLVSLNNLVVRTLGLLYSAEFFTKTINMFNKIDYLLKYDGYKRDAIVVSLMVAIYLCTPLTYQIYSIFYMMNPINTYVFSINLFNNVGTNSTELQFITFSYLLKKRFQIINNRTKQLIEKIPNNVTATISIAFNKNTDRILEEINELKESQKCLINASENLNENFSAKLFFSLSCCFFNSLFNIYYAIFGGYKNTSQVNTEQRPLYEIINDALWGGYYGFRFISICAAATFLCKEYEKFKVTLSNLIGEVPKCDLQESLLEMQHYSKARKLKFTAYHFCSVNLRLVGTAIHSGTTYLVILAQFHKS